MRALLLLLALLSSGIAFGQAPAPGSVFRDCEDCPEMVAIPPGSFRMGSPRDAAFSAAEAPRHEVQIGYTDVGFRVVREH